MDVGGYIAQPSNEGKIILGLICRHSGKL